MLYLILSVCCSAAMSVIMRFSEPKIKNRMVMFLCNYLVCICLARLYMGRVPLVSDHPRFGFTVLCGAVSGVLFLVSLAISQWNIGTNGLILSSTFSKLGVLVPTAMAVIVFKEQPGPMQIAGFVIALGAIMIMHFDSGKGSLTEKGKTMDPRFLKFALIASLLVNGVTESMSNIYDKMGEQSLKDHFLFFNFVFAALSTLVMILKDRQQFSRFDVLTGLVVGVPNYMSSRFILYALGSVPATVAYPVSCVGGMVLISILGMLIFGERLSKKKLLALGMIMFALVLLNL